MPSKRGVSKKFNRAKCFTSPRKIDKKTRRQRAAYRFSRKSENSQWRKNRDKAEKGVHGNAQRLADYRARLAITAQSKRTLSQRPKEQESKFEVKVRERKATQPVAEPPNVRVFALGHFNQLLRVVVPGSIVALDIDETIIITKNMPSLLLETKGVLAFQKHVTTVFPDFESRNKMCRRLQEVIKYKKLVEEDTANVIRELQNRNCRVFCLTARYSELAARTDEVLGSFGISLKESAPFPSHPIQDPITKAVVMNGVVYCNGADKGRILCRLLSSVILPREAKQADMRGESNSSVKSLFPGLHFVDDRLEHTLSVRNSLQSFPSLRIPAMCFHYRSPVALQSEAERVQLATNPGLLRFIMHHFVKHDKVLSNREALALMAEGEDPSTEV